MAPQLVPTPVDLAAALIRIPSVNPMGVDHADDAAYGERGVAEYLLSLLTSYDIGAEVLGADPRRPLLIARIDVGAESTALLEAHMDTVSPNNMSIEPFGAQVEDGLLYGRGACDTKGSLACFVHAVIRAVSEHRKLRHNVILAAVHDEEYSFAGAKELVHLVRDATFAVVGEPTELNVVHAHKGVCRFIVSTSGIAAHGSTPALGINAIYKMVPIIVALQSYAGSLSRRSHPELGSPTLNVGGIKGGEAGNIVAPYCEIDVDRRLLPDESFESVRQELTQVLTDDATIHDPYFSVAALHTSEQAAPCLELLRAASECGCRPKVVAVDYATDASIYHAGGIPSVVYGPGSIGKAHTKDEFVPIDHLDKAAETVFHLLT